MAGGCRSAALLGVLVVAVGCDPNLGRDAPPEGTSAIFNPFTGEIPLPNDALLNPETNQLEVPIAPEDSELTEQVKQGLSMINGWIPGSMITIPFDGELDTSTLNGDSVRLYDVTNAPAFERISADDYYVAFNVGRDPATEPPYTLYVRRKPEGMLPPDFEMGHSYLVVVTDAVRDVQGRPVLGTPIMELLKSRTPLANEFGRTNTILPDADAQSLERTRKMSYAPAFDALEAGGELNREEVIAHAAFRIQSNPMPAFNPMLLGRELPSPIDALDAADAPTDAKPWVCFHHPIDPQTAAAGAKMYERGASLTEVNVSVSVGSVENCDQAVILDPGGLDPATTYQIVLTDAIVGKDGAPSRQSSIFSLVAKTVPLLDDSTDPPSLNSPFIDSTFDALLTTGADPTTATQEDWDEAYTTLVGPLALGAVETWRKAYQTFIDDAVAAGTDRDDLTVTWTFTTAAQ